MTDTPRAWRTVLNHIEADLLSGALHPGDRLPGERALAAELGVGRSSVREAIRVLEVLGLISTSSGSGPSSGAIIVARPGGGMSALMRLQVAASGFDVTDVVDTRVILEAAVAHRLAASEEPYLGAARELLTAMDADGLAPNEFLALDTQFHLSLAEANGNQVIVSTMAGMRSAVEAYVVTGFPYLPSWSETANRLRDEHRGIIDAIVAGDPEAAEQRARDHITGYFADVAEHLPQAPETSTTLPSMPGTDAPPHTGGHAHPDPQE